MLLATAKTTFVALNHQIARRRVAVAADMLTQAIRPAIGDAHGPVTVQPVPHESALFRTGRDWPQRGNFAMGSGSSLAMMFMPDEDLNDGGGGWN